MKKLLLAAIAVLSLAACTDGFRLKSADQLAVSISPSTKAKIDNFCSATLVSDNMAAIQGYANLYTAYIQPLSDNLPALDLDGLTSREQVVSVAEIRTKACDLYVAGMVFGVVG